MAPGGFWKKTYVIHPGIGVARIGGPDPCRTTTDQIIALNNAVASVEAALPKLSGSELAEAKKLIAVDKAKLTQLQTSLAACRQKPEDFFVGPEVPDEAFVPPNNTYRVAGGAIRRQAARFRIYEYAVFTPMLGPRPSPARRAKVTVREITANEADI